MNPEFLRNVWLELTPRRMAIMALGKLMPMPLQCGTWKKRFLAVTGPIWTGSNRIS